MELPAEPTPAGLHHHGGPERDGRLRQRRRQRLEASCRQEEKQGGSTERPERGGRGRGECGSDEDDDDDDDDGDNDDDDDNDDDGDNDDDKDEDKDGNSSSSDSDKEMNKPKKKAKNNSSFDDELTNDSTSQEKGNKVSVVLVDDEKEIK